MKNTVQNAIKISAFAIALAFSGASHAEQTFNLNAVDGGMVIDNGGKFFKETNVGPFRAQSTPLYELTSDDQLAQKFFAYCIAPTIDTQQDAVYTAHYNAEVKASVKALFEMAYAGTVTSVGSGENIASQTAFQLALWELNNDDGDLFATGGHQYFTPGQNVEVEAAQALLAGVSTYKLKNLYSYTSFTGVGANGLESQEMLAVTPVPEVETWAMLAAGLGLVGMMGRRRRQGAAVADQKFA